MRAFSWLRNLTKCESGNVLFIGAATLPMVMGAAGLAVDTVQLALWKRQLQRGADSAAIAGAHALAQGASSDASAANDLGEHIELALDKNEMPPLNAPAVTPGSFAAGTISTESCAVRAVTPCYNLAVRVALVSERRLPFMNIFTGKMNVIEADGTAAVTRGGEFCMISLHKGNSPGIIAGGNPKIDLTCGIATNSVAAANAINIYGDAEITASPLSAVGGIAPGKNSYSGQQLQPNSNEVMDPYAGIAEPTAPASCPTDLPSGSQTVAKGSCFGNWNIGNGDTVQLEAGGIYYVKNGQLDIKGALKGTNVTIVLLGDNSSMTQNGGGILDISAPTDGTHQGIQGIAVYRSRFAASDSNKPIKINGGAELNVTGAVYMPSTDIWIGGNADFKATCLQVVGRVLEFKGGGSIKNECKDKGTTAFAQPVVRLVG